MSCDTIYVAEERELNATSMKNGLCVL